MRYWFLLISILCGILSNLNNECLRLIFIALWAGLPIIYILANLTSLKLYRNSLHELVLASCVVSAIALCMLINVQMISVNFFGPDAESLTPILYGFYPTTLILSDQIANPSVCRRLFLSILWSILFFLIADMLFRLIVAPQLFLNYHQRHAAKTIGFMSTTNVTGQIIAFFFLLSMEVEFKAKRLFQVLLVIILISTMARSALVALLCAACLRIILVKAKNNKQLALKRLIIVFSVLLLCLFIVDPMHFRQDGSLLSKLQFFESTYHILLNTDMKSMIFGSGPSYDLITSVLNVNGWSPHIPLLKSFLYYGFIGVGIFVFFIFHAWRQERRLRYPILAYLIFSLAGSPIFWPPLMLSIIILKLYDRSHKPVRSTK